MQRIQNRLKHDNADLLSLIERCSQILKDDRLYLRTLIKENNPELITLLTSYKKKNDLRLLQQELRKLLHKAKGKGQVVRNSKENNNSSIVPSSKTPVRRNNIRDQTLTLKIKSPPQRSISKQANKESKTSEAKYKQEPSPRFVNENLNQFVSPQKIEQQRWQLQQFEEKLKMYASRDNFNNTNEIEKPRQIQRDNIVLASFQNFNMAEYNSQQQMRNETHETNEGSLHEERQYTQEQDYHVEDTSEYIEQQQYTENRGRIISQANSSHKRQPSQILFANQIIQEPKHQHHNTEIVQPIQYEQLLSNREEHNVPITEDDIMKKYADLFTSPEILKQCRASCPTYQTQESVNEDPQKFNFMVPCQSMVYQQEQCDQNEQQEQQNQERNILSQLTSEQVFQEIFSEPTLHKLSRAFFKFKMEIVYQQLDYYPNQEELEHLFRSVDKQQQDFIDLDEFGEFIDNICPHEDRQIFHLIDQDKKGYFTKQELENALKHISRAVKMNCINLGQRYFIECDVMQCNRITYWNFFIKRNIQVSEELIEILKQYLELL